MEIRDATEADIPRLVEMGRHFFAATAWKETAAYDGPSFAATLGMLIASDDGIVLIADFGMTAAICFPLFFNQGQRAAQEIVWWVEPDHRGKGQQLLRAMECEAEAKGAMFMIMVNEESLRPDAVARVYRRHGYAPSEQQFVKRLGGS